MIWETCANAHAITMYDHLMEICDVTTTINRISLKGVTIYRVHLAERTCVCNKWQAYGIPCSHAIVACKKLRLDCLELIQPYYELSRYFSCYELQFEPIPNRSCWPDPNFRYIQQDMQLLRSIRWPCSSCIQNEMDWRELVVQFVGKKDIINDFVHFELLTQILIINAGNVEVS